MTTSTRYSMPSPPSERFQNRRRHLALLDLTRVRALFERVAEGLRRLLPAPVSRRSRP